MTGDALYRKMARAYWNKPVYTLRPAEREGWEAAARVLLEDQLSRYRGPGAASYAKGVEVCLLAYARSIGIDLTSPPAPAQEAAQGAGTDQATGQKPE